MIFLAINPSASAAWRKKILLYQPGLPRFFSDRGPPPWETEIVSAPAPKARLIRLANP